jgi:hypothetical protein
MPGRTVVVGDDDDDVYSVCEGSENWLLRQSKQIRYKHVKLLDLPTSHVVVCVVVQRSLHSLDTVIPFLVV